MNGPYEADREDYKGYTIKILYDEDAGNPFEEWDQMGTLVAFSSHTVYRDSVDNIQGVKNVINAEYSESKAGATKEYLDSERLGVIIPFQAYDLGSSGWSFSIGTPGEMPGERDDGFIYATRETILHEYSAQRVTAKVRERAISVLTGELESFGQWLKGEVYGYVIEDADGNDIDSLWGMYGLDYAREEAREVVDREVESKNDKHELAMVAGL